MPPFPSGSGGIALIFDALFYILGIKKTRREAGLFSFGRIVRLRRVL
jgi:hypothetical protein